MTDPRPASDPATLAQINAHQFVSLTTFRRTGVGVATAVWIAAEGEHLVVTTPAESGKVKRLRANPAVEIRPCSRRGTVAPDAPVFRGTAEIVTNPGEIDRSTQAIRGKYRLEFRIVMAIEKLTARRSRSHSQRVILRISVP